MLTEVRFEQLTLKFAIYTLYVHFDFKALLNAVNEGKDYSKILFHHKYFAE